MSLTNFFTKNIILPIGDYISNQTVSSCLDFLFDSQNWTINELEAYQNEKLRKLIEHSYQNVQFYREKFDDIRLKPYDVKSVGDLWKLPILSKNEIRINILNGKLIAVNISENEKMKNGSSGSTGEPLHYYITRDAYSLNIAAAIRGWYWMGYKLGDKFVKLSQNPRNNLKKKLQDRVSRNKYLFSQQLTNDNFRKILSEILEYGPKVLRGYPDPLFFLAKFAHNNSITDLKIPIITTTGNILFPEVRKYIEQQFHGVVYDSYSCEGSALFSESKENGIYYGASEYAITEIINNDKSYVDDGERGRHITTDLHNLACPFIRYDTQDYVTKIDVEKKKKAMKELVAISRIDGRDNDILVTPSGKYLIVHNFTGFFQNSRLGSVKQFQIIQESISEIIIKIVVDDSYCEEIEKYIINYWKEYIGDNVAVFVSIVNDIPITKSGKRRFIVRNSSIKL